MSWTNSQAVPSPGGLLYFDCRLFGCQSLLLCIGWLRPTHGISRANVLVTLFAAFVLFIGDIIVVVSGISADKINNLGQHIGLSVSTETRK